MKILLDSGHGGTDPGAVNQDGIQEKDIALSVVLKLSKILRDKGFQALLTRDKDIYISPADRLKMINNYKPDAFISVHCNSSANSQAHGIETIYRDDYDYPLAQAVHKSLLANIEMRDRGIKNDIKELGRRLAVLGNLEVPACLVEIGFISNEGDLEKLDEEDEQQTIAEAISEGIEEWV
ncbi:MAG: N-acetylmuramoyl-L-alanine amidase [Patescibacteria group bacterium]